MRKRIEMKEKKESINSLVENFLNEKKLYISPKTLKTYRNHLNVISNLIDFDEELTPDICNKLYSIVYELDITPTSKNSYLRTWKCFVRSVDESLPIPKLREIETVKEVYTDDEMRLLTAPPKSNCTFSEFRNFCIVLVLYDTGMRAGSLRNILCKDVQLDNNTIVLRHNKTGRTQTVPFGSTTAKYLKKYINIRDGAPDDYFFCNVYGEMFKENGLSEAMAKYIKSRGVERLTSIHSFRHTWARTQLLKCGASAFAIQKMMNHTTLRTTNIYCRVFDKDIIESYVSPMDISARKKIR